MPRSGIQVSLTACWSTALPVAKSAISAIAMPSETTEPATVSQPASRFGTAKQSRPTASGSQRRTFSISSPPSRRRDQEVEGEGGDTGDDQQRVGADEAALQGADAGAEAADSILDEDDEALD